LTGVLDGADQARLFPEETQRIQSRIQGLSELGSSE
jgi:hypothetical protein